MAPSIDFPLAIAMRIKPRKTQKFGFSPKLQKKSNILHVAAYLVAHCAILYSSVTISGFPLPLPFRHPKLVIKWIMILVPLTSLTAIFTLFSTIQIQNGC